MIKTEIIEIENQEFKRTYSDNGFYIRKKGTEEIYEEAMDLLESTFEYEETEELIPIEEIKEEVQDET